MLGKPLQHFPLTESLCPKLDVRHGIFRLGDLMHLSPGILAMMVAESVKDDAPVPCHKTLSGGNSVCRGFSTGTKRHRSDCGTVGTGLLSVSADTLCVEKHLLDLLKSPSEFFGFNMERAAGGANECWIHFTQSGDCLLEHLLALRAKNRHFHAAI